VDSHHHHHPPPPPNFIKYVEWFYGWRKWTDITFVSCIHCMHIALETHNKLRKKLLLENAIEAA
jgi:hypothetical protein